MTYFVTGSNGFIGRSVCFYLEHLGDTVIKHDRFNGSFIQAFKCDAVVHLSAYGNHYQQKDVNEIIKANITCLGQLVDVATKSKILQKFYNISTSSVTLPVQTIYSASKLFGETLINSLNDERFVNVRPYSVYGPGEAEHRFIPTVIRHLIFLDDFVKALFEGCEHIGSGKQATNAYIVACLEELSGKKLNYSVASMRNYDTKNWVCPTPVSCRDLKDGIKQTWEASL